MAASRWRLLGFDAREHPEDCDKTPFPHDIREELFLPPEITCPFSVDNHIWPTQFLYFPQIAHLFPKGNIDLIETDPDCEGGLWLNLARMQQRLSDNKRKAIRIAVELFAPEDATVDEFPSSLIYSETDPKDLPGQSVFLGYDVADVGFCSGLSNCGYTLEERDRLRPQWKNLINDFGLIETQQDALTFKEISDRRVPEHLPFWVYRLHRLTQD